MKRRGSRKNRSGSMETMWDWRKKISSRASSRRPLDGCARRNLAQGTRLRRVPDRDSPANRHLRRGGSMWFRTHVRQVGLFAVLLLGLALRLWGIQDRLPDPTLGINIYDDSA